MRDSVHREVLQSVGADRFEAAGRHVRATPRTGMYPHPDRAVNEVPHDVGELLESLDYPVRDRLEAGFDLYEELPTYALLIYLAHMRDELDDWEPFWERFRSFLGHEDHRLADPVVYYLWVDDFEIGGDHAHRAWAAMLAKDPSRLRIRRLLEAADPVPWPLKRDLYERLLADPSWHAAVFRSVLTSVEAIYGSVDLDEAVDVLRRIDLNAARSYHTWRPRRANWFRTIAGVVSVLRHAGRSAPRDGSLQACVDALVGWLRQPSCSLEAGLSDVELDAAEAEFGITFPPVWREVLARVHPVSRSIGSSYPDWRRRDVEGTRGIIEWPTEGVLFDVEHNGFWWHAWGPKPGHVNDRIDTARHYLDAAPRLTPIRLGLYMGQADDSPVFRIWQTDISIPALSICDIPDRRDQSSVPVADYPIGKIPLWSRLHAWSQIGHATDYGKLAEYRPNPRP